MPDCDSKMRYRVMLPMAGPDGLWFELCVVYTTQSLQCVIEALCRDSVQGITSIKIEVYRNV